MGSRGGYRQAMLVDTHCHLDPHYFPEGALAVMDRASAVGVSGFVVIGVGADLAPARFAADLAARHPSRVRASVGIHPHDATSLNEHSLQELTTLAQRPQVAFVGEIGLDYHYDHSPRAQQHETFRRLVQLARVVRKPIVVHTREAREGTRAILEEEGARDVGGIIHCFSEDRSFATRALDLGFYLSFSGIVTFKKSLDIQDVATWAPADRILVETDAPYLAPMPYRGKPYEPAMVVHTARKVAELRGISEAELAVQTTKNARTLLGDSAFAVG